MKITHALLGEHGAIYALLDLLERTASTGDLAETVKGAACLHSTLISHAAIEDTVLRPAIQHSLPRPAGSDDGLPPRTDHEIIEEQLTRVLNASDRDHATALLRDVIASTRKHFAKEETIIFPLAERELTVEEQERLGAEWAARRTVSLAQ